MPTDSTRGPRRDLELVKGKAYERFFYSEAVYLEDGVETRVPLDLTQGTLRAKLRRKLSDTAAAITFIVEAAPAEGPGVWRLYVDAVTLANAALVSGTDREDPRSFYERWDCEFAISEERVIELYWGEVYLLNEATR